MAEFEKESQAPQPLKRCFLALNLPRIQQVILKPSLVTLKGIFPEAKWVSPENIHLTLHFFGEVPDSEIRRAILIIKDSLRNIHAMSFEVSTLGKFPLSGSPRVIWAGLTGSGLKLLTSFQNSISQKLSSEGFRIDDRSFHPHITLARIKMRLKNFPWEEMTAEFDQILKRNPDVLDEVTEFVFYQSQLSSQGSYYSVIEKFVF